MILPIFPEGGLTSSVITTVWVGVFILAFFNLRFGWVMSGLVVPGYLVPLLILRPIAAGVIVVEAVLTYLIVWLFSERLARGRFNALFGRDRFMGLVLASIAVRVTLDGWLLPLAAEWLSDNWNRQIDWQSNLQSFGLVVISLLANQLWKPGLVRGLISFAVVTGLTFLVVRYGLMEWTNFRLSGVSYVYEGLASSILASPKAYIILVFTAFIASQMNVRYGWDFSGILIPALIALQWYQPAKILSSFVEAGVIYFLAIAVMKLPVFANVTIEGARKLVLFFNVSFVYKLVLGHGLNWLALDVKTTDFYGFGYLLSTLLAIKAYDKDIFPRVMRSTLEVSLAGAVAGNFAGFVLALLLPPHERAEAATALRAPTGATGRLVAAAAGDAHVTAAGLPPPDLGQRQARELGDAIELLESGARPDFIAPGLADGPFRLTRQDDGMLALARRDGRGRDLLLFNPASQRPLAVVVADAAAQPGIAMAGLTLFREQGARWLIVAAPPRAGADPGASLLGSLRATLSPAELVVEVAGTAQAGLELAGSGATALDMAQLRRSFPGIATRLDSEGAGNRAVLTLDDAGLVRLAGNAESQPVIPDCEIEPVRHDTRPEADLAKLAFLRFEVAEPIAEALTGRTDFPAIARRNAALAGWSFDTCLLDGRKQWQLATARGAQGTYLFAPAGDPGRTVETHGDSRLALAGASAVHRGWNAGTLLIAPSEDRLIKSQRSSFGVVSQVVLRSAGTNASGLIQVRPAPSRTSANAGANLAIVPDLLETGGSWGPALIALSRQAGFTPLMIDRSMAAPGLEIAPNPAVRYLSAAASRRYATFLLLAAPAEGGGNGG